MLVTSQRISQSYFIKEIENGRPGFKYRDLKQARTATAVNKQINFTVKNKPHTTNYIYCIFYD